MFQTISGWYWPTSAVLGENAEKRLLRDVNLQFKDVRVPIGDSSESFVHCAYNASGNKALPVVMAHGLGAGLAFFYKNFTPLVDDGWPVYAFDWLGMGRSGRPPFPTFPQNSVDSIIGFFIESLEKWREGMNLEKFILLGHSLGGYLSALYALKYPNRVQSLILSSPVGLQINVNEGTTNRVQAITGHEIPGWLVSLWNKNYTPQTVIRTFGPIGPRLTAGYVNLRFGHLGEEERSNLSDYLYQISADVGSGEYALAGILMPGAWAREPLHGRLPLLSMPCHFVYGEMDWVDYRHAAEASQFMTARTSITRVPNAGHHLYLDNPDEYNQAILKILSEY